MWKWINQHVTSVGQRKKLSPWQDSNIWPPTTWRALYPLELWRTHGERGHILGSYLTCIMHTARIMSMLYCVVKEWKMENFKLGELNVKMKSSCQERGPKKKSESPTGFEPMTFQKPGGGRGSIHLSYNTDILKVEDRVSCQRRKTIVLLLRKRHRHPVPQLSDQTAMLLYQDNRQC